MKVTGISTVFVYVSNLDRAKEFYGRQIGLGKVSLEGPSWAEWKIARSGTAFAIQKADQRLIEGSVPARNTIRFSFVVDDIRKTYNELFEEGIRVHSEPKEGTGFIYVDFEDPDRNVLRAVQYVK